MKKISIGMLSAAVLMAIMACVALAEMNDVQFGGSVVNTTALTNSYVVRGEVGGVLVTLPTVQTCTVVIASSEGTIFTKTVSGAAGNYYYTLRYPAYGSTGSALGFTDSTGTITNAVVAPLAVASKVTAIITRVAPTAITNTIAVQLNVNR